MISGSFGISSKTSNSILVFLIIKSQMPFKQLCIPLYGWYYPFFAYSNLHTLLYNVFVIYRASEWGVFVLWIWIR